jgi:hypothetical protein
MGAPRIWFVYEDGKESRLNTMEEGWSCNRDRQGKPPDRIGKICDIKKPQGGLVSNLRSFNKQTTTYGLGANPIFAQLKTMALIGGRG